MPVITMSAHDLKSLVARPVSDSQLDAVLPLIKCEIESWEGDELKVEVTPDRPDLLSTEGIARQISSWLGFRRGLQKYNISSPRVSITAEKVKARPELVAGCVRGLALTDEMVRSVMQLQEAIDLTVGRGRVKTATGVHDLSRVKPPFYYREAGPEEVSFVPLGFSRKMTIGQILKEHPKGVQYRHIFGKSRKYPIIVDRNDDVLSFPPIINGELTKVTPGTKDIFLDITGFDQTPLNYALNILLTALHMRGGKLESVRINNTTYPHVKPRPVVIKRDDVKRIMGLNLKDSEISDCLERMGYSADMKTGQVMVPAYRADIIHPYDVIEDVAIAYGLNNIVPEIPRMATVGGPNPEEEFALKLKNIMVGLGFQEMVNLSLSSDERQFIRMRTKNPGAVEIENPISGEYSLCRHWLVPTLLENLSANIHRRYPQRIFELSECVHPDPGSDTMTRNVRKLACAVTHAGAGFSEIMSVFRAFIEVIPLDFSVSETSHPSFIPGRCASILLGKDAVGHLGEVHPGVLAAFGLKMPVACFEIDSEKLWDAVTSGK